ncbi:hypothetical protein B4923_05290 [Brenneria roseae subsp. americana]|uniref:Uncharacterized protein n=1 Tax=Brenneria roseae subsp. americana TaxID=1508507 RepID=A0A2U1TY41_9GAMM|nr:hypothetical protein [Brenneria roseae]PWC14323.1 hypothetical protein B4923_05290 [Brenneria roseae subsp. americana]
MNFFEKDFNFIYLKKEELVKISNLLKIEKRITLLQSNYCLYYFNRDNGFFCDLLDDAKKEIGTIFSEAISFDEHKENIKIIRSEFSPLLENKSKLLDSLLLHYHKLKSKNSSLYSLRFSFSLNDRTSESSKIQNAETIKTAYARIVDYLRKFLNFSRQKVLLKKIVGYFWVILRDYNGLPYIHINFYLSDGEFNSGLALEIKQLWENITNGSGCSLIFEISKNYGNNEVYNDKVSNLYSIRSPMLSNNKKHQVHNDFNRTESLIYKYDCLAEDTEKYERYLTCIARESYPVYTLNSIIKRESMVESTKESDSVEEIPHNKKEKSKRKLDKFRGYSVSQIKNK